MESNPATIKEIIDLYNDKKSFFEDEQLNFNDLLSLILNPNHFNDTQNYNDLDDEPEEEIDDIV